MAFELIARRRLDEELERRIGDLISSGESAEGDILAGERDPKQQFDVGRPAVREGLLTLQQKGFEVLRNEERARVVRRAAGRLTGAVSSAVRVCLETVQSWAWSEVGSRGKSGLLEVARPKVTPSRSGSRCETGAGCTRKVSARAARPLGRSRPATS